MIDSLYPHIREWSSKGSIYLISDTHFLETDMNWRWELIKDYPFAVLDELPTEEEIADRIASYIVYKINSVVHKNDTLVILGDVGDTSYITKLKSKNKILIKGNHDSGTENYLKREQCGYPHCKDPNCEKCKYYKAELFNEVYNGPLFISDRIVLSHEPMPTGPYYNIHGHTHRGCNLPKQLNVCCEFIDFKPISLKDFIMSGALKDIKNIHREYIDGRTKKNIDEED